VSRELDSSAAALHESGSVVVATPPEDVYDMVADVTRMGEWSPVCRACRWEPGHTLRPGALFRGRNEAFGRTWETTSQVVVADRPRAFAFVVAETGTRWGYEFRAVEDGTEITETWDIPEGPLATWKQLAGSDADAQIRDRTEQTRTEIVATLAAIKRAAESPTRRT
jgi:hypothetical protein